MPKCTTCGTYHKTSYKSCPPCRERNRKRAAQRRRDAADGVDNSVNRRGRRNGPLNAHTADEYEALQDKPPTNQEPKFWDVPDPWVALCDQCSHEDGCFIPEGAYQLTVSNPNTKTNGRRMLDCAAAAAKWHGWTPDEALTIYRSRLYLLPPEE